MPRTVLSSARAVLACCLVVLGAATYAQAPVTSDKIAPSLRTELSFAGGAPVPVYVVLHEQVSGRAAGEALAARGAAKRARTAAAVRAIRAGNTAAQAPLIGRLGALAGVREVRGFWLVNMIAFEADAAAVATVAGWPEVAGVFYDGPWEPEAVVESAPALAQPDGDEPGHANINATVLRSLGYTGFGGIAFTADTGVDPYHPALNFKYAGHGDRPGSWYDLDPNLRDPFDCGDHGTHVTGTILGLDRGTADTIGVAPNAHWVGAGILCGVGTSDNIGAFQWAIDPDGDPDTDADRPTVINNSWRDPNVGDIECNGANPYPLVLDNLMAAGIAVVFSAGNSGPEPRTITPPHNYNSGLVNAFTVGALSGRTVADFSSRGPALCLRDSTPLDIKPEVSAPGVSVRSCLPGTEYGFKSGTSMAAPHVAGAILLLHEAFPQLLGEDLQLALYYSATDLGVPGEDNDYGRGIIDVKAAYDYLVAAGHQPAPPAYPALALNVIALEGSALQCGGELAATLRLRNDGTEAINSVDYRFGVSPTSASTARYEQAIAPGEVVSIPLNLAVSELGEQNLRVLVTAVNDAAPNPGLDLGGVLRLELSPNTMPRLVSDLTDSTTCLGSAVALDFDSDLDADLVPYFADDPSRVLFRVRDRGPYVIDSLTAPVTLYGQPEYLFVGGPDTAAAEGDLAVGQTGAFAIRFRALRDVRLRSVTVYAPEDRTRVRFHVRDAADDLSVAYVSERVDAGYQRVEVDAELVAGEAYTIDWTDADLGYVPDLSLRTSDLGDFISVTSVTGPVSADRRSSYFFFDWELGYLDGCPVQEVTLTPDTTRQASELVIDASAAEVEQFEELVLTERTGLVVGEHAWYREAQRATTADNVYRFAPELVGKYEVQVTGLDEQDCSSSGFAEYTVRPQSSSTERELREVAIEVFPNPATASISVTTLRDDLASARIVDALGRAYPAPVLQQAGILDVRGLPAGAYRLLIDYRDGRREIASFTKL